MKRGDSKVIFIDGKQLIAQYLGKGHYAKAYQVGNEVFCFVEGCFMKEAIAGVKMPHVPEITQLSREILGRTEYDVYKMPYYEPLTAKHQDAWKDYRVLEKALQEAKDRVEIGKKGRSLSVLGSDVNYALHRNELPSSGLRDALEEMSYRAANYGSGVTFEFAPRNLGIDDAGRLVLRDVLFDAEKIEMEYRTWQNKTMIRF